MKKLLLLITFVLISIFLMSGMYQYRYSHKLFLLSGVCEEEGILKKFELRPAIFEKETLERIEVKDFYFHNLSCLKGKTDIYSLLSYGSMTRERFKKIYALGENSKDNEIVKKALSTLLSQAIEFSTPNGVIQGTLLDIIIDKDELYLSVKKVEGDIHKYSYTRDMSVHKASEKALLEYRVQKNLSLKGIEAIITADGCFLEDKEVDIVNSDVQIIDDNLKTIRIIFKSSNQELYCPKDKIVSANPSKK